MKHEMKHCPRCHASFECKVGDIANCQCNRVRLHIEEIALIEEMYDACLCVNCIYELKRRYVHFVNKYLFQGN